MHLRLLGPDDLDAVVDTFFGAFADYVVDLKLDRDDLHRMMARRGADLRLSAGAFDGESMVAVMVVAAGDFEAVPSAYDVFTGVVPAARGRGLARRLFDTALPALRARGAKRFVLEVIQKNEAAVRSYRKAGFTQRRRLRVFAFREVAPVAGVAVEEIAVDEAFALRPTGAPAPSWQNDDASIRRVADDVVALRAREGAKQLGIAFCVPRNRDVPQLHVLPGRADAVQALLARALSLQPGSGPLRVVNVDAGATDLCAILAGLADEEYPPQYEMVRAVDGA